VDPIGALDSRLGDLLERGTEAHHRRRLRRIGRDDQRTPPDDGRLWAAGDPPPRAGNGVEVLIDGAAYFPALADAIAAARSSVHIAGWCISPEFALGRAEPPLLLRELLADAAERIDVRVLLWAGAPAPVFPPRRSAVREAAKALTGGTRIRVALDAHERPMHCHHEKLAVIDGETAFVGGIDITSLGGDRWDTPEHPARGRLGWHDVAARVNGPAVADVAEHLAMRWSQVTGEPVTLTAAPPAAGDLEVQVVRTVPEKIYDAVPRGDFRILEAYRRALRSAQRLVYLENQFLWSPEIGDLLAAKLREPPHQDFRVIVMLPGHANNGEDDTRGQLALLSDADEEGGGGRFLATTIMARTGRTADRVYVHAKVGIVDDHWLTLGSANLNAHSLYNDTEMNLVVCDEALARSTRARLWASHLECGEDVAAGDPAALFDERWAPLAAEQRELRDRGMPATHRLLQLVATSRRADRLLGPLQGLVVDG